MKIMIYGSLPPPIGGVTKSVYNLVRSLKEVKVDVCVVANSVFNDFMFVDYSHIQYSKAWKRFLGVIIGKILSRKVIFTVHGSVYDGSLFNRMAFYIVDGVIFLNDVAVAAHKDLIKNKKYVVFPSVFKEGVVSCYGSDVLLPKDSKKNILLYASYKKIINGCDVYGVDFIMSIIDELTRRNIRLVFLDPNKAYSLSDLPKEVYYINKVVDSAGILSQISCYIRPTLIDGDPVFIHESLAVGCPVIASDAVPRIQGVVIYKTNNEKDFLKKIDDVHVKDESLRYDMISVNKYLEFLRAL